MPQPTVRFFPLSPAPFSVHLVLGDAPAGATTAGPFVRLSGDAGGERAYEAVLIAASGAEVRRLVLKLPREQQPLDDDGVPPSGAALELRWAAAHRDLAALASAGSYFPAVILPATSPQEGSPALLPPMVFCTVHKNFFHIPCPRCFSPLRTCRDDVALAGAGLPLYSTSATRLLVCPSCLASGETVRFFATSRGGTDELATRGVSDLDQLRRDLAESIERARQQGTALPSPEVYPCATCEDAGACLGMRDIGKGKSRTQVGEAAWLPFNLHDSPYLLLSHSALAFDEFADLLGGHLPADEAAPAATPGGTGYLCQQGEGSGVDAVEVLALKLALFLQVAKGLREYHRLLGFPHLDLHPGHLVVEPSPAGDYLPRLWDFQVHLLGTSSRRVRMLSEGVRVVLPPRDPNMPYLAPTLRSSYLIRPRQAELILDRLVAVAGTSDAWHIEGRLADPQGFYPRPGTRDVILMQWSHDIFGTGSHVAVARVDPRQQAGRSLELAVASDPVVMDPMAAHHLERASGLRIPDMTYRCYPAFGAREDTYALGVILLRTLLANDQQGLAAIEGLVSALLHREGEARGPGRRAGRETVVAWAFREHPAVLAKANVFYRRLDRDPARPNAIPDELWASALGLGFDLIQGPGDAPGEAADTLPSAALERSILAAEDLHRRLHAILFSRQAIHVEVQSVIAEVGGELDRGST